MDPKAFFEHLARSAERDSAVVATLRRSLAFEPGAYPAAFPYVEPFTAHLTVQRRQAAYLAAALWASAQRRATGLAHPFPVAWSDLAGRRGDKGSLEARFVAVLDADFDELTWRLRHAVSLLSAEGIALDWPQLLQDLLRWTGPEKPVQQRWARVFWRNGTDASESISAGEAATSN